MLLFTFSFNKRVKRRKPHSIWPRYIHNIQANLAKDHQTTKPPNQTKKRIGNAHGDGAVQRQGPTTNGETADGMKRSSNAKQHRSESAMGWFILVKLEWVDQNYVENVFDKFTYCY